MSETSHWLEDRPDRKYVRSGWIFGILALLFHFLLVFLPWSDWFMANHSATAPVKIHTVDPALLNAIKRRDRSLLLSQKSNQEKSDSARYFSDSDNRVNKETRAKDTSTMPQDGGEAKSSSKTLALNDLGVPINKSNTQSNRKQLHQALVDPNLPESAENLLNTEQSVFYSYYSRLYQAIAPNWESRLRETVYPRRILAGEYRAEVEVVFSPEGKLISVNFLKRSGIPEFDSAITYAWQRIYDFPNPPRELLSEDGFVHTAWNFTVTVGEGNFFNYAPPEQL